MHTTRQSLARLSIAALALTLAGCGSLKPTYVEDGRQGFFISCKGYLNSWSSCVVKAGRMCRNKGYSIIHSDEYDRTLLIACKLPEAKSDARVEAKSDARAETR
jgi:hypothetical protein